MGSSGIRRVEAFVIGCFHCWLMTVHTLAFEISYISVVVKEYCWRRLPINSRPSYVLVDLHQRMSDTLL